MTTDEILDHHLKAFDDGDVDEILTAYDEASILITPQEVACGPVPIRRLFEMFLTEVLPPGSKFEVLVRHVVDGTAYIVWKAESEKYLFEMGTDTFVVRDGKIAVQTTVATGQSKEELEP